MSKIVTAVMLGVLAAASLTGCSKGGGKASVAGPSSTPAGPSATSPAASPSVPVTTPTLLPKGGASTPPNASTPNGTPNGRCSGPSAPSCTGVPAGLKLKEMAPTSSDGGYVLKKAGAVYDGVHFRGDVLIAAENITIKNSLVDLAVRNELAGHYYSFVLLDSTVGPAGSCQGNDGIGRARYYAQGVLLRGHTSGFMDSGDDITIRDSYVKNCSYDPSNHVGGIQAFEPGQNLVVDHTTFDQYKVDGDTAPIFLYDSAGGTIKNVSVTNTLFLGGTYSFQLKRAAGRLVVKGNSVVNGTWDYAPVEAQCADIDWSGNKVVTIDSNYRITSVVRSLPCAS